MNIAVCDDDIECRQSASKLLQTWLNETQTHAEIDVFDNGDDLIESATKKKYDIIFLDVIMPLLDGIQTAQELRENDKSVKIVFLTSSSEFALESYSVKAADYCLKPTTYERIRSIMADCVQSILAEPKSLILKTSEGYQKIYLQDIEYASAFNKNTYFYLRSHRVLEALEPLYKFEKQLSLGDGFFKCHRSYIVYIPNVTRFNTTEIVTTSGAKVPIARGYSKDFHDAYFSIIFND